MQRRLDLATLFATRARSSSRSRRPAAPWILGWQGSPLEAPAHSVAGCERALELGLDGFAIRLHRTRDAGLVAGERADLEGGGKLPGLSRAELAALDVGALFSARFRGLGPAFAEDFLALAAARAPRRWLIILEEPEAIALLAALCAELGNGIPPGLRIASSDPATVREAAALGFAALYITTRVDARELKALCAGKVSGLLMALSDWSTTGLQEWPACERWTRADHPLELETALRAGFEGILTSEPLRAQAVHELVQLTPGSERAFPLELPRLLLEPTPAQGWMGSFEFMARVRNPLAVPVQVTLGILPRMGAFSIQGLPQALFLDAGEHAELPVRISGGARQPGADPLLFALLRTSNRRALLLDGPLERVRIVPADPLPLRVALLGDAPGRARRTLLVRRHRQQLLVSLEGGRELEELRIEVRLGEHLHAGVRGVRMQLPADWDRDADGIALAVRVSWMEAGERREARLCGGLPEGPRSGAPARLVPFVRA